MEIQHRVGSVFRSGIGGDKPAVEPGLTGIVNVKVNFLKSDAGFGGSCGDGAGRMKEKLPLALVEEQTEGAVSAEGGEHDSDGEARKKPSRADVNAGGLR